MRVLQVKIISFCVLLLKTEKKKKKKNQQSINTWSFTFSLSRDAKMNHVSIFFQFGHFFLFFFFFLRERVPRSQSFFFSFLPSVFFQRFLVNLVEPLSFFCFWLYYWSMIFFEKSKITDSSKNQFFEKVDDF